MSRSDPETDGREYGGATTRDYLILAVFLASVATFLVWVWS